MLAFASDAVTGKPGFAALVLFCCLSVFGADYAHAAGRITAITGLRDGQTVKGELFVETKIAGANDGADYWVRYEVAGPSGFIMTAERAPYVLAGRRTGWDTGNADTGSIERHRGFYIIDRSVPVAFEPGQNHNVDNAILLRRFIE